MRQTKLQNSLGKYFVEPRALFSSGTSFQYAVDACVSNDKDSTVDCILLQEMLQLEWKLCRPVVDVLNVITNNRL